MVNRGSLFLVHAHCPLEDVLGPVWPGDSLSHDLQCTACGRDFHLHADTYHGWVSWEPDTLKGPSWGTRLNTAQNRLWYHSANWPLGQPAEGN